MTQPQASSSAPTPESDSVWDNLLPLVEGLSRPPDEWIREHSIKLAQGGERLRAALSGVPFYAKREANVRAHGGSVDQFWQDLFTNEINLPRPPAENESSTAAST